MNSTQESVQAATISAQDFCNGVMPRALLSIKACELALQKSGNKNAKEFAGFELLEANTVVDVLKELGTVAPPITAENKAFIERLSASSGNEFDRLYMQAELSNHEFLRDLADNYLKDAARRDQPEEGEARHLASLALYAFTEHVAMAKRIHEEVSAA